jgi:hypothetical protein
MDMLNAPNSATIADFTTSVQSQINPAPSLTALLPISRSAKPASTKATCRADADRDTLIAGIVGADVYLLDTSSEALSQITQALAGYSDLTTIQIFSHGSDGVLQLGNTSLNTANLMDYAGLLQSWASV